MIAYLPSRLCAAALLVYATSLPAQAHEMNGIDHVHLSDTAVQIIEPVPGVPSASPNYPTEAKAGVTPKPSQASGLASLLIQIVLIGSVFILMMVALKAGASRRMQAPDEARNNPGEEKDPAPSQISAPD